MQFIEAQVLDAQHLKLSQRLALIPGSKVFITITPPEELAAEHEAQAALSAQGLAGAYGDQEPEYSPASIKKPNPEFHQSTKAVKAYSGSQDGLNAGKSSGRDRGNMMNRHQCSYCEDYKKQGHNYCRMCGFHLTKGYVQNVSLAVIYNTSEKFCGYCGGTKHECSCVKL